MARKIIFKEGGLSGTDNTPSGFRFLGYNGETISEKYGATISAIGGSGSSQELIITTTRSNIVISASNSTLQPGVLYHITDAHTALYGGNEIVVQAISTSELNSRGMGKFYNPKYTGAMGSGVWNNIGYFTTSNFTGTFSKNENITANNGAVANVKGLVVPLNSGTSEHTFFTVTSGNWTSATSITGNTSGATTSISNVNIPSYSIGQKLIWGGKVWTNLTGSVGSNSGQYALDGTNWSQVSYNTTDYNVVWDEITYDFNNDFITSRRDKSGNYVEQSWTHYTYESGQLAIKSFQWGNGGVIYDNSCINSVFETINFKGVYITGTLVTGGSLIVNNTFGYRSLLYFCKIETYSEIQNNFFFTVNNQCGFYEVSFRDFTFLEDSYFTNISSMEACNLFSSGFYDCALSCVQIYDCTFQNGGYLQHLNLYNSFASSTNCYIRFSNFQTLIRFKENFFPYPDIYHKNKNITGVYNQASHIDASLSETYPYITRTSPIWEDFPGGGSKPTKNLIRKGDNSWAITYLTSGGTFSVTNI